jgi:drug/metabolite transporter (DMT)-like permease
MTIIWGTNFAIVKQAFRELDPQVFNALRMMIASAVFLVVIAAARPLARRTRHHDSPAQDLISIFHTPARITPREWVRVGGLGFVGHALYQYFFIGGLARTSVANSSLVLALTPVLIGLTSAVLGHERIHRTYWIGASVSLLGIYLVVGRGFELGRAGTAGDLMMFGAVCCWAAYTLGSRPLMTRHSPVGVSGLSMALGTAVYVPLVWPKMRTVDWTNVSGWTLWLVVYSALFALCVAYTIWYIGVRQIGSARTAMYSNFIPIVAMMSAVVFLGEPLGARKILGAAAVLAGVTLTRVGGAAADRPT